MKKCNKCRIELPLEKFSKDESRSMGVYSTCKECNSRYFRERRLANLESMRKEARDYYAANKQKVKDANNRSRKKNWRVEKNRELTNKFGIGLPEYEAMLELQRGVCAICNKKENDTNRGVVKALAVDHDHDTGKVRGLLCSNCNKGIGNLQDNSRFLENAVKYLKKAGTDKRFFHADFTGVEEIK